MISFHGNATVAETYNNDKSNWAVPLIMKMFTCVQVYLWSCRFQTRAFSHGHAPSFQRINFTEDFTRIIAARGFFPSFPGLCSSRLICASS